MNKQKALHYLNERRRFFIDKKLFGRAETIESLINTIQKSNKNDFTGIETVGLYIEPRTYTSTIIYQ